MNYRHGFHAGNFADVVKHATLARILLHLCTKPAAFRVLDTHAGAGLYDLEGDEATRGGEWQAGIARLREARLALPADALLAPYLTAIDAVNAAGLRRFYPGSPLIAQALLRKQDRLTACELEPNAAAALSDALRGNVRVKAVAIDGWMALKAYLPPKERRGLVVLDPPFEDPDEFGHLADALAAAHRKWPTGIMLVWYPIKRQADADRFLRHLRQVGLRDALNVEFSIGDVQADTRLVACGLVVVNPPWALADELANLLPALAGALGQGRGGFRIERFDVESRPRVP